MSTAISPDEQYLQIVSYYSSVIQRIIHPQRTVTNEIHFLYYNFQTAILSNDLATLSSLMGINNPFLKSKTISVVYGMVHLTNFYFTNSYKTHILWRKVISVINTDILHCFIKSF